MNTHRSIRSIRSIRLVALAIAATTTLIAQPALAAPAPTTSAGKDRPESCAINLLNNAQACAPTAAEASVRVLQGAGKKAVGLATFYENIDYSPSELSKVLVVYGNACTARTTDIEYTIADLTLKKIRDTTWNDRISSVRTYRQCDVKFFEDTHGHGAYTGFIDSNPDLRQYGSGWSDRASSLRLS